jgi:hypothetical protein
MGCYLPIQTNIHVNTGRQETSMNQIGFKPKIPENKWSETL